MLKIIEDESPSGVFEQLDQESAKKEPSNHNRNQSAEDLSQIIAQQEQLALFLQKKLSASLEEEFEIEEQESGLKLLGMSSDTSPIEAKTHALLKEESPLVISEEIKT